ncbi:MAG: hypothetical protein AAF694_27700 [Bacteroidota bacterium]
MEDPTHIDPNAEANLPERGSFFEVPDGFFQAQQEALFATIEEEELKKEAPLLFSIPKKDFLTVPEGFFDRFPGLIQKSLETKEVREISLRNRFAFSKISNTYVGYGIAAVVAIFLLGIWITGGPLQEPHSPAPKELVWSEIPTEVLIEAVSSDLSDTDFLAEAFSQNGIEEIPGEIFTHSEWEEEELEILEELDLSDIDLEAEWLQEPFDLN